MSIQIGDKFPSVTLKRVGAAGLEDVDTGAFLAGRKVVVVTVPGAFTPACTNAHLPGYLNKADDIKAKGVDEIACLAVNDPFVMKAWSDALGAEGKVTMLPDGNGQLASALGITFDGAGAGLGTRYKRGVLVVEDGVVKSMELEDAPPNVTVTSAESCLVSLG